MNLNFVFGKSLKKRREDGGRGTCFAALGWGGE